MKSPRRLDNRTMCVKIITTLVQARAKHQARLNALPSAADSKQSKLSRASGSKALSSLEGSAERSRESTKLTFSCQREQSIKLA